MLTELKNRGLKEIFIAAVDGLTGFPDAIEAVYPDTRIQLCIVHMVRNSLKFVSWKDRKAAAADLKKSTLPPPSRKPSASWRRLASAGMASTRRSARAGGGTGRI